MGQAYQARDTRLGRDLAIQVSAERFDGRFEALAIASLNHSNICTQFDRRRQRDANWTRRPF